MSTAIETSKWWKSSGCCQGDFGNNWIYRSSERLGNSSPCYWWRRNKVKLLYTCRFLFIVYLGIELQFLFNIFVPKHGTFWFTIQLRLTVQVIGTYFCMFVCKLPLIPQVLSCLCSNFVLICTPTRICREHQNHVH